MPSQPVRHTIVWLSAGALLVVGSGCATSGGSPRSSRLQVGGPVPPEAVLAEVPFLDSAEPNRIFVDLAPEGYERRLPLMLDTGCDFSVMTPRVARSLRVSIRRVKSSPYRRATLLGRDLQFRVDTDSSDTASRTGWEYGLLGGNFLREYVVDIDFRDRWVRFLDPDRYAVPESAPAPDETVVPLRFSARRPVVQMTLNGTRTWALLDTGTPFAAHIGTRVAEKARVRMLPDEELGEVYTTLGKIETAPGEVDTLGIGSLELSGVPIVVQHTGFNIGTASDGFLGYGALSKFRVRIDYPRRRMWLKRNAEPESAGADLDPLPSRSR